jgi:hypothetical protein
MKALLILLFSSSIIPNSLFSQESGRPEIGVEGFASASTNGGAYSLGLKFGFKVNENIIIGPSLRIIKNWSSMTGSPTFSTTTNGFGGFLHARYGNTVFAGIEYELFRTPVNSYGLIDGSNYFASTLFLGAGFSKEYKNFIRINAGIFYDAINQQNSPFRSSYMMKKTNSATGEIAGYIPVIYRLTFFFPIGKIKEESNEEEEGN